MKVELLQYTPEPERAIALGARLCYSKLDGGEIDKKMTDEQCASLIKKLASMGHGSAFEHASFTFSISGVSRTLTHELVRHRIGCSYNQRSQRYVTEDACNFITPPSIEDNEVANMYYKHLLKAAQECYNELVSLGIPKEDARYVLPNATETKIMVTMNARALMNFFRLRCCNRAQWEIRALAWKMLQLVKEVAPNVFSNAGPSCMTEGVCHEGDMSCGLVNKLNESKQKVDVEEKARKLINKWLKEDEEKEDDTNKVEGREIKV